MGRKLVVLLLVGFLAGLLAWFGVRPGTNVGPEPPCAPPGRCN